MLQPICLFSNLCRAFIKAFGAEKHPSFRGVLIDVMAVASVDTAVLQLIEGLKVEGNTFRYATFLTVEKGNVHHVEDIFPPVPAMNIKEIIFAHNPYELRMGEMFLELFQGEISINSPQLSFDIRYNHFRMMTDYFENAIKTSIEISHIVFIL